MSSGRDRRACATTTQDTPTTSGEKGSTRSRNTIRDCTTWDATSLGSWTELSVLIPTHFQAFYKQKYNYLFFFRQPVSRLAYAIPPPRRSPLSRKEKRPAIRVAFRGERFIYFESHILDRYFLSITGHPGEMQKTEGGKLRDNSPSTPDYEHHAAIIFVDLSSSS